MERVLSWLRLEKINILDFMTSKPNLLFSKWRRMERCPVTQIEFFALNLIQWVITLLPQEVGTTPYNFMTSERKAQSAASMVLTSVEMPSISTTMDTPYWLVPIDKRMFLNSGTSEHSRRQESLTGMGQRLLKASPPVWSLTATKKLRKIRKMLAQDKDLHQGREVLARVSHQPR